MIDSFRKALVKIIDPYGKSVIGLGLLVNDEGYIVTTSDILSPYKDFAIETEFVNICFVGDKRESFRKATVMPNYWLSYNEGNITVLHYKDLFPTYIEGCPLGSSESRKIDDSVQILGFNSSFQSVTALDTQITYRKWEENIGCEIIAITQKEEKRFEIYGGSPVLNHDTGNLIGIVMESSDCIKIIPSEFIQRVFPEIRLKKAFQSKPNHYLARDIPTSNEDLAYINQASIKYQKLCSVTVAFFINNIKTATNKTRKIVKELNLNKLSLSKNNRDIWKYFIQKKQHQQIGEIIRLLSSFGFRGRLNKTRDLQKELIKDWIAVEEYPYKHIYGAYLNRVIEESEYVRLDRIYIELLGTKYKKNKVGALDPQAIMYEEDDDVEESSNKKNHDSKFIKPNVDSVLNIARQEDRFMIIGAPGSGKTVSLKKIIFQHTLEIMEGNANYNIPVLVVANQFTDKMSFHDLILQQFPDWDNSNLDKSKFLVMVDGFNEINPNYMRLAQEEIHAMLESDEGFKFILSSRTYGFAQIKRVLQGKKNELLVFELKDLNASQVSDFIEAYMEEYQYELKTAIFQDGNEKIRHLAFSPLSLFMLIVIFDGPKTTLPQSRGELFKRFIRRILERTSPKDIKLKEEVLCMIAYFMRQNNFNPPVEKVISLFTKVVGTEEKSESLLQQFCENYILKIKTYPNPQLDNCTEERVTFMHESYLEYFCAQKLRLDYVNSGIIDIPFERTEWFETVLMTADLFDSEDNLAKYLIYLFYGGTPRQRSLKFKTPPKETHSQKSIERFFFYDRAEIACKAAYRIKSHSESAYNFFENAFLNLLEQWETREKRKLIRSLNDKTDLGFKEHFIENKNSPIIIGNYQTNIEVLRIISASTGGLSSEKVFEKVFTESFWQLQCLIPNQTFDNRNSNTLIFRRRLVRNLSDYEALYDFLKDKLPKCLKKDPYKGNLSLNEFFSPTINAIVEHLQKKMPLKLLKKLYEKSSKDRISDSLLEKIGQQDPEYYIEKFDKKDEKSIQDFVDYLLSFSYNKKVQNKLFDILFSKKTESEMQEKIATSLMKKFYNVDQVLKFLNQNYTNLWELKSMREPIMNYLSALPMAILPVKLKNVFELKAKDIFPSSLSIDIEKELSLIVTNRKSTYILKSGSSELRNWFEVRRGSKKGLVKKKKWYIYNEKNLHPDIISKDKILIKTIDRDLPNEYLEQLLQQKGLIHLFYWHFKDVNYGIVLKVLDSQKKVLYYSSQNKQLEEGYLPEHRLRKIRENDLIVVEDNGLITHLPKEINSNHLGLVGFQKSFIADIKKDGINEYLFIHNPESKDFFLHKSLFNFSPKKFDRVWFYPCLNFTTRYPQWPLARKIKLIGGGTEELGTMALNNRKELIEKYSNTLKLQKLDEGTVIYLKKGLIINYFEIKDYDKVIDLCIDLLENDPKQNFANKKIGQAYGRKRYWQEAIKHYREIYRLHNEDRIFLEEYATFLTEVGKLKKAGSLLYNYFRKFNMTEDDFPLMKLYLTILLESNNYVRVEREIERIDKKTYPIFIDVILNLAIQRSRSKNGILKAFQYFNDLLDHTPSSDVYLYYAVLLYRIGEFTTSEVYLLKALKEEDCATYVTLKYYIELARIQDIYIEKGLKGDILSEKLNQAKQLSVNKKIVESYKLLRGLKKSSYKHKYKNKAINRQINKQLKIHGFQEKSRIILENSAYTIARNVQVFSFSLSFQFIYSLYFKRKLAMANRQVKIFLNKISFDDIYFAEVKAIEGRIIKKHLSKRIKTNRRFSEELYEKAKAAFDMAIEHALTNDQKNDFYIGKAKLIYSLKREQDYETANRLLEKVTEVNRFTSGSLKVKLIKFSSTEMRKKRKKGLIKIEQNK